MIQPFFLAASVALSIPFCITRSLALALSSSSERLLNSSLMVSTTSFKLSILSERPATVPKAAPTALATYKKEEIGISHSGSLNTVVI